jgi:hypothetical protein
MGGDLSMHLERCSREFKMEHHATILKGQKAQLDIICLRGSPSFKKAQQLQNNIKQTLKECWQMSGEDYESFQELVMNMEEDILQALCDMEQLVRLGSRAPEPPFLKRSPFTQAPFPQGKMSSPEPPFSQGRKGTLVMAYPQDRMGSSVPPFLQGRMGSSSHTLEALAIDASCWTASSRSHIAKGPLWKPTDGGA